MSRLEKIGVKKYKLHMSKTQNGVRQRKTITLNGTKSEVEDEAVRLENEFLLGVVNSKSKKITLYQFAQIWFNDYGNSHLKAKTSRTYKDLLNKYVLPDLGRRPMSAIVPAHILSLYTKLRKVEKNRNGDLLSPTTITHIHSIIHKLFTDAVRWQYIIDNPVDRVPKPKRNKPKPNYYTEEQLNDLLNQINHLEPSQYKWKVGTYIAFTTGLRLAEISGLMWDDIDFINNTIMINRTRKYVAKVGIIIDTPKTETSFRTVTMPSILKNVLQEYIDYLNKQEAIYGDLWQNSNYVLVDAFGEEVFPDSLSKWFSNFIRRNDLPHLSIHGLRHTMATILIHDPNVPERTISDRLGHANTNTLRKIYSHQLKETDKIAADSIDSIFRSKKTDYK